MKKEKERDILYVNSLPCFAGVSLLVGAVWFPPIVVAVDSFVGGVDVVVIDVVVIDLVVFGVFTGIDIEVTDVVAVLFVSLSEN